MKLTRSTRLYKQNRYSVLEIPQAEAFEEGKTVQREADQKVLDACEKEAQEKRTPKTDLENELADKEFARQYRDARIKTTWEIKMVDELGYIPQEKVREIFEEIGKHKQKECLYCGSCHDLDDSGALQALKQKYLKEEK